MTCLDSLFSFPCDMLLAFSECLQTFPSFLFREPAYVSVKETDPLFFPAMPFAASLENLPDPAILHEKKLLDFRKHRRMVVLDRKDTITGFLYYFFTDCLLAHHRVRRDQRVFYFQHVEQLWTGCHLVLLFKPHSFRLSFSLSQIL